MIYREIGRTGKRAGIIGLGCEHLDRKPYETVEATVRTALDLGVNYMDMFMPGTEVRQHLARALGDRRGEVYIQGHMGSSDIRQQYDISRDLPTVKRFFEEYLRLFGHVDFGMLFFIDSDDDYNAVFDGGIADYALERKRLGDIHHIGFSSHSPATALRAIETGVPEIMMFSINLAFDLNPGAGSSMAVLDEGFGGTEPAQLAAERLALYRECERRGIGISVMKSLGAGKLLSPQLTPFAKPMTAVQAIHYALSRPAVFAVLPGAATPEEMRASHAYLAATDAERDFSDFLSGLKQDFSGRCVYCSHCQPCPVEIDIAAVHRALDQARLAPAAIPGPVRDRYDSLAVTADACIACGSCEERCPFGVPVIANMAAAAELFAVP